MATPSQRADVDWRPHLSGLGLLAGPANVVMQLAMPAVGYGVVESRVASGRFTEHPWKRTRTTVTYLAVALLGDDSDRAHYRQAVSQVHAQVVCGAESPQKYSALNPRLQLWVAACLYRGLLDVVEWLEEPLSADQAEALHAASATFGTTLQVRPDQWPATRADFDRYWADQMAHLRIDEPVRTYLDQLVHLRHSRGVVRLLGPTTAFITKGFLPDEFRQLMQWSWSSAQERRFRRCLRLLRRLNRMTPRIVRNQPYTWFLRDMRRRAASHKPLV